MKWLLTITLFTFCFPLLAQEVPLTTEQQLENLNEESIEDDALLQQLAYFQKHPLNLNVAMAEELSLLRFLTSLQIQNLLSYRQVFGKLLSIYELQAVPGFDLPTIQKLLPFVFVGDAQTAKETLAARLRGGSQYALFRISRTLERPKGYDRTLRTHYLGDRNHLQARYIYQYKNLLYYGVVADKDAGEAFFKGAQNKGFDFYSVHFFVRNLGRLKALALGDYTLNLGQGLVQWQTLAFGKSGEVSMLKRQAPALLPYRSAGEFYFNRGAAATVQLSDLHATVFVSYKSFSGNTVVDSTERFSSFNTSGYHRTKAEIADRNRLTHFSSGGSLSYAKSSLKIGVNAVAHRFSLPLQKRDEPYNRFALSGKNHFLASADYSYTLKNTHLFGEVATDSRLHRAMVHGALISVDPKVDLSFLYRNIAKEFQSPFGNAFTESALPGNEKGFYTGIHIRPRIGWQLAAYADYYEFPFLKYRVSAPTRGWDYLIQVTAAPNKRTEAYLRFRTENKPLDGNGQVLNYPINQQRQNLRLHLVKQLSQQMALRARGEMTWFKSENKKPEKGLLAYVESSWSPLVKLRGNLRVQYFKTDGYNSRMYAYESDVLYSFSIPAFFDKGVRYYFNASYQISKGLTGWIRLAQTLYHNKTVIGSGLDEIQGNHRTDVRLQLRYVFN
jgi:hypothetical protein